ncbi:MAG: hypothetical protein U9R11_05320 [Chloroflexota bacterium]|nr:hypothetical protein [Chloroflexota bacterium]
MASRLRLFVSAGPDLEPEREIIGQAIAKLPVPLGWVIKRTPHWNEPFTPALEEVKTCDFYVLLLGADIQAPVGWELRAAQQAGKKPLAFLKKAARTPAARIFLRTTRIDWAPFSSPQELGFLVQKALAEQILERAQALALNLAQLEALSAFLKELSKKKPEEEAKRELGGAGEGGVIFASEEVTMKGKGVGQR